MNRPLASLVVLAALLASGPAPAGPPDTASPKGLDASPPPEGKSPVPKASEWVTGEPVKLARVAPEASGCTSTRVREWLRIRCPVKTFAISLLGGSNDGLAFWIGPEAEGQPGEVQFPVRRGDRRVIELWTYGKDDEGGFAAKPSLNVQEQWVEGEPAPTITISASRP